jgi:AcrR family transcriptional regulator
VCQDQAVSIKRTPRKRGVGRPENADSDVTRRQILDAARACFSAQGYAATTTRMIADAAEVAPAAVYHHFGRKQDLMIAVHEDVSVRSQARIRQRTANAASAREMVEGVLDVIIDFMAEEPGVTFFEVTAFEEARRHPELSAIADDPAFLAFLNEVVCTGIASGEIDPTAAQTVKLVLFSFFLGFAGMANHLDLTAARGLAEGCKQLIAGQLLAGVHSTLG